MSLRYRAVLRIRGIPDARGVFERIRAQVERLQSGATVQMAV